MARIEQQEYSATGDGRECADEVVNDNVIGKEKTKDLVADEKIGGGEGGWDEDDDYEDEDYDDEDEEEDEDYDDGIGGRPNAISCRPGLIWCLSANRCVPEDGRCGRDGDDENDYEDDEDVMTCNPGYVWCLSASDCVPENRGCKGGREWWDDDDEEEEGDDDDGKEIRCRQGKIFCASVQVRPNGISDSGGNFRYFLDQQMTVAT